MCGRRDLLASPVMVFNLRFVRLGCERAASRGPMLVLILVTHGNLDTTQDDGQTGPKATK